MVPSMTKKGYNSIKEIYQEILTDSYWEAEWDQMKQNDPYICKNVPRTLDSR